MTTVAVTTEARYIQTPDGEVWSVGGPGYSFWERYLRTFEIARLLARVQYYDVPPAGGVRVSGPGVEVCPLPYYVGAMGFLHSRSKLYARLREAIANTNAIVLRVP